MTGWKLLQQRDTAGDERAAHDQGGEDPEHEDALLVAGRDLQRREDEREDEDVVDRQALLDQVAGQIRLGRPAALPPPQQAAEAQAHAHPHRAPGSCLPQGSLPGPAVQHEQVQDQDREHESAERRPGPGGHVHGCRPGRAGRGAVPAAGRPASPPRHVRSATAIPLRPRPDCTSASANPAGLDPLCRAGGDGVKAGRYRPPRATPFHNDLHGATPPALRCPR